MNKTEVKRTEVKTNIPLYIAIRLRSKEYFGSEIWLPLPATQEQFLTAVDSVCECWDDLKIDWYSSTVPCLFISEIMKTPLAVLNHLAARLNSLSDGQILTLTAIMESQSHFDSVDEIIEYTYNADCYAFIPGIYTHEQLGRLRVSELDFKGLPRRIKECIDPEIFGIQTTVNETGWFTPLGYVSSKKGARLRLAAKKKRQVPAALDLKGLNGEDLYVKTDCCCDFDYDCGEYDDLPEYETE